MVEPWLYRDLCVNHVTGCCYCPAAGAGGKVEQQPDDWVEAAGRAATAVIADALLGGRVEVLAIALSGQMQDVVLVADGRALRPALLYSDVRASTEAADIEAELGLPRVARALDNYKGAASCLAKWLWLARHEPSMLACADAMLLGAHSYLAYRFTGGKVATDLTTACTTGMLDRRGPAWAAPEISTFAGLDMRLLPDLPHAGSSGPLGTVCAQAVAALGLPAELAGVPVFHGVGDVASTTIGATGLGTGGGAYLYLGTSGWVADCRPDSENAVTCGAEGLFNLLHPAPGLCMVAASMTTAGGNVEWARRLLLPQDASLAEFDQLATRADPGSGGVIYMPHVSIWVIRLWDLPAQLSPNATGFSLSRHCIWPHPLPRITYYIYLYSLHLQVHTKLQALRNLSIG